MNKNIFSWMIILSSITLLFTFCSDNITQDYNTSGIEVRSTDPSSYFDFENIKTIPIIRYESGSKNDEPVPWSKSASTGGISNDWLEVYPSNNSTNKIYTRANGWSLAYSNTNVVCNEKHIVLYNRYTGILRFFVKSMKNENSASSSVWQISSNYKTSLLNFSSDIAKPMDNKSTGSKYFSKITSINGNEMLTQPINTGVWFAFDIEVPYDEDVEEYWDIRIEGDNITKYFVKGISETNGLINGTISSVAPSNSNPVSISLSNSSQIIQTGDNSINMVGDMIEKGTQSNNNSDKKFWNSIKNGLTKGANVGASSAMKAIFDKGGSVATSGLGKIFSSIIGFNKPQIQTVDLKAHFNSQIEMDVTNIHKTYNPSLLVYKNKKSKEDEGTGFYSDLLGVWNLRTAPVVYVDLKVIQLCPRDYPDQVGDVKHDIQLSYSSPQLVVNPAILKTHRIKTYECHYATPNEYKDASAFGLLTSSMTKLYYSPSYIKDTNLASSHWMGIPERDEYPSEWSTSFKAYANVYIELENIQTKEIISFSKYFEANVVKRNVSVSSQTI